MFESHLKATGFNPLGCRPFLTPRASLMARYPYKPLVLPASSTPLISNSLSAALMKSPIDWLGVFFANAKNLTGLTGEGVQHFFGPFLWFPRTLHLWRLWHPVPVLQQPAGAHAVPRRWVLHTWRMHGCMMPTKHLMHGGKRGGNVHTCLFNFDTKM